MNNIPLFYRLTSTIDYSQKYGWNKDGGNEWSLQDCTITSVVYANGTRTTDANKEPLIGALLQSNPYSVQGKLSVFDVGCQNKSALYGVTLGLKQNASSNEFAFLGDVPVNSMFHQNQWFQVPCNSSKLLRKKNDPHGARSSGKLKSIKWAGTLYSKVLQQLKESSESHGGVLSYSMAMYDFSFHFNTANHSLGRLSGSIGYARPSEPRYFEGERMLSFEFVDRPNLTLVLPHNDACLRKKYIPFWLYRAPFKLHTFTKTLTVDYSSSFSRNNYRVIRDLGTLYLGILNSIDGRNLCIDRIGTIDYQEDRCRNINGCIMDYKLSDYHFNLIKEHQLVVVMPLEGFPSTNTTYPLCRSSYPYNSNRMLMHNDHRMVALMIELTYLIRPYNYYTFILENGDIAIVDLYVTLLSQPAIGKTVQMVPLDPTIKPANGVTYNHESIVNEHGYARFVFRANSIKYYPRQENDIDGQLYFFNYYLKGEPRFCAGDVIYPDRDEDSGEKNACTEVITIKVYSDISYSHIKQFTWVDNVQSIFLQYARLYPVMKKAIDLSSYDDVTKPYAIQLLNYSMQLDINHPNYMPASRDLSNSRKKMILEWLTNPCYNSTHCLIGPTNVEHDLDSRTSLNESVLQKINETCMVNSSFHEQPQDFNQYYQFTAKTDANDQSLDCIKELKDSVCSIYIIQYCLQKAIELEFYTIPPYLTALYTIKDDYNTEVKKIIRSVVMQEMLHMLQAANLLISVGGRPIIDSPNTAPAYPATGLPGGVFPHLTVSMKKASLDHIYSVFMAIEYPHKVIDSPLGINIVHAKTIGQLYSAIKRCFIIHGDAIFYPNRTSLQVKWPYSNEYGNIYIVHDLATAMEAIKEITEQGEGAQPGDPRSFDRNDLAHFFKFKEIICGRKLVFHGISNYSYTGDLIPFDESGVWPMRDNPSITSLIPGTLAYGKSKTFHDTYRSLLAAIDNVISGHPEKIMETVSVMESLEIQAKLLVSTLLNTSNAESETSGPIWDYYFTNN